MQYKKCIISVRNRFEGGTSLKRTAEKILTWVGILVQFVVIAASALALPFLNDASIKQKAIPLIVTANNNPNIAQFTDQLSPSTLFDYMKQGALLVLAICVVCCIIAMISVTIMGKFEKFTGILLILIALINVLTINVVSSLLWLIAGIMLVLRRRNTKKRKHKKQQKRKA